jgi:hypothetical protein
MRFALMSRHARPEDLVSQPAEALTLAATLERLERRGFTATFEATDSGLRARETGRPPGRTFRPHELAVVESYRFEGASDPDDLSVLYGLEAADGTRGTVVDAFGPYADPALARWLRDVPVRGTGPVASAPGRSPEVSRGRSAVDPEEGAA